MPNTRHPSKTEASRKGFGNRLSQRREQQSAEMVQRVRDVVKHMVEDGEQVTFREVERRANVSHWFVYQKAEPRQIIEAARGSAVKSAEPQPLQQRVDFLASQVAQLSREIQHLRRAVEWVREQRLFSLPEAKRLLGDIEDTELRFLIDSNQLARVRIHQRDFITGQSLDALAPRREEHR